ncbi:hypothetical protein AS855_20525 [Brucella intermedia M86]|nr:hypothetical protein AS855_20525 [Brucella intermedia M86]
MPTVRSKWGAVHLDDTTALLELSRAFLERILEFLEDNFQHALQLTLLYVRQVINTVFHQHGRTCRSKVRANYFECWLKLQNSTTSIKKAFAKFARFYSYAVLPTR